MLDEPLAALDISTRTKLRRTLAGHLERYDGPRLLITHDPTDAFLLADHLYILEGGVITQSGSVEDVRRRPATPYVAALAGLNLLSGTNSGGTVDLDDQPGQTLISADTVTNGPVLVTIHPNAIALHPAGDGAPAPEGSPAIAGRRRSSRSNRWVTSPGSRSVVRSRCSPTSPRRPPQRWGWRPAAGCGYR